MADRPKTFGELFAAQEKQRARSVRVGDEVSGTVVALGEDAVFVDLGAKAEAVIERAELVDREGKLSVAIGDSIRARVAEVRDGQILLRTRAGRSDDPLAEIARAHELRIPVMGKVRAVNKGGVEVDAAGLTAFCPISQLDLGRVEDAGTFVGRELEFFVTSFERGHRPNVVLSRRAYLEDERAGRAAETRARLAVGEVMQGPVTRLTDFGAFVDLGGLEGLVHKSELGFGRVGHPSEVLSVGDMVEVMVTRIETSSDPKKPDRIGLSLKALKGDPFAEAGLVAGERRAGKVVRLEPFGAFVELVEGVEGLVHVSELSGERHVSHPREVVSLGQLIEVTVLSVDQDKRRVALSLKDVAVQKEAEDAAAYTPASNQSLGTFADLMKKKLGKK